MSVRHNIIKSLLCLTLVACAGSGPGDLSTPIDGSASVGGGGNYAAGPVSLPAPATLNKNLIVCENVAGPTVVCRGSAGAAPAFAKVNVSVHPAGFASWRDKLESLFIGTANAAGFSVVVTADGSGAFSATVEAVKDEVIQIQVGSTRLLLTVPEELGSVSGASGTMKNMTVDSDGNIWFSRQEAAPKRIAFRWTSLFFSEAQAAQEVPSRRVIPADAAVDSLPLPDSASAARVISSRGEVAPEVLPAEQNPEGAACSGPAETASELSADAQVTTRCEVKRLTPGSDTPEVVVTFPGCVQDDVRFIRPTKKNDNASVMHSYILVGIRRSIYVVEVGTAPAKIVKRLVFPAEVLSADDLGDDIYVTLNGQSLPESAPKVYMIEKVSWGDFDAACIDNMGLQEDLAVYQGIQSVVSVDTWGNQFVLAARFAEGYRLIAGMASLEFVYTQAPKEIFRSASPMEVVQIARNWQANRNVYAVLVRAEKKLYLLQTDTATNQVEEYSFDLSAFNDPYGLRVDRDNQQVAFIDRGTDSSRLVLLPYTADKTIGVDLNGAVLRDLGNVTPSGLVRVLRGAESEWTVNCGGNNVQRFDSLTLNNVSMR